MEVQKSTLYALGIIVLVVVGGFFLVQGESQTPIPERAIAGNAGDAGNVQEVVVGMKSFNYYPESVTVTAGKPVRFRLDNTVGGCFRDLTIRELGVRTYVASPSEYVEFTPT